MGSDWVRVGSDSGCLGQNRLRSDGVQAGSGQNLILIFNQLICLIYVHNLFKKILTISN